MSANKNFDHVKNEEVKKLLKEEHELMKKVFDIRDQMKEKRSARDAAAGVENPKVQRELDAVDAKIEKLQAKKELLYQSMSGVDGVDKKTRDEIIKAQDHLRIVRMDIEPLERELTRILSEMEVRQKKAEKLSKEVQTLKASCGGKNAHNMATQVAALNKKLEKETEKGNESLAKSIKKEIRQLETDKVKAEAYHVKNQELKGLLDEINGLAKTAAESSPELEKLRKKREELENKLPVLSEEEKEAKRNPENIRKERETRQQERDAKYQNTRAEIKKVSDAIADLIKEKDNIRLSGKSKELDTEIKNLIADRKTLEDKVKAINEKIPRSVVKAEQEYIYDLVGPGGATLKQIEEDFGVVIDIKRQEGEVEIRGTACEDCADAVTSILDEAKANRLEERMKIDPDVGGEFIGSGGSQIQLLQTKSGCNINFSRETGDIVITGNKENIATAVALINDFKSTSYRVELKFGAAATPFLRGNLMRQWQEEFSCRLIKVDPNARTIVIIGKEESVKKAEKHISAFAKGAGEAAVINIPSTVPHFVIIGNKGDRVRSIESETGCILEVKPEFVKIAGTPENVERAKKLVNTLISENVREEVKIKYNTKMHNFLTRRRPAPAAAAGETHVDPNAEPAEEGKEAPKDLCLLDQIRLKWNCDRINADLTTATLTIRGPKDTIKDCVKEIQDTLNFVGSTKETIELDNAVVRWLCQNLNAKGTRGVKTRLDDVRNLDGIEDIVADFRGESKKVEIIGSKDAVAAAKEKLFAIQKELEPRMADMEIESFKVGRLLGRGGMNVSKIEADLGVLFHIPRTKKDAPRNELVRVTIIAPDAATLQEAKEEADKTMADY